MNEEGTTEQTTEREMILEVQTIEPDAPRSWFLGDEEVVSGVLFYVSILRMLLIYLNV